MSLRLERLDCPRCSAPMKGGPFDTVFVCGTCGAGATAEAGRLEAVETITLSPPKRDGVDVWRAAWVLQGRVEIAARQVVAGGPLAGFAARGGGAAIFLPMMVRLAAGRRGHGRGAGGGTAIAAVALPAILEEIAGRVGAPAGILTEGMPPPPGMEENRVRVGRYVPPDDPSGIVSVTGGSVPPPRGATTGSSARSAQSAQSALSTFVVPAFDLPLRPLMEMIEAWISVPLTPGDPPGAPVEGGSLRRADAETLVLHHVLGREIARPDVLATIDVIYHPVSHRLAAIPLVRSGAGLRCGFTGTAIPT